jgi:CspA family cold shock protein
MAKGKIKWYNELKGYGFIASEDGEDIFLHRTGLADPYQVPEPGQTVVYETKQGEKGLLAVDVKSENP